MNTNNHSTIFSFTVAACLLASCSNTLNDPVANTVTFSDVSETVGLKTQDNWKYGGPSVSDLNNDGYYDLLLTNHDTTPVQLFMAKGKDKYLEQREVFSKVDLHGIAAGDYDLDGDNDILLSVGGGNGLHPRPQRMLRNDEGTFTDITEAAGVSELGARGRSVRWVDLDSDGDLDFLQVNAAKMVNESAPRNIIFENRGNGQFTYFQSPGFEEVEAERLLITDYNNDHIPDVIAFTSYGKSTVWKGNGDLTFTNTTGSVFPAGSDGYPGTITVAQADIDNDGDLDYYFARGKLYYTIANNAVSFDAQTKRLDLRDQGSKSHDGMDLFASGPITLTDFYHFPRANLLRSVPVFLGKNKRQIDTPTSAVTVTQKDAQGFPDKVEKTGWYLGYVGENKWRFEWVMAADLAWDLRASIIGVERFETPWEPQDLSVPDVLLRNDAGVFTDISHVLPEGAQDNNWGVTTGDFDNNGFADFFVYRFGELKRRVRDVLLLNQGDYEFSQSLNHNATTEVGKDSHGDGGIAADFNLDGRVDILSGDDDNGKWHLYHNQTPLKTAHYVLLHVGYSPRGIDPLGAKVWVKTAGGQHYVLVGSPNANHSQSLLNIVHVGLAQYDIIDEIKIRWRSGEEQVLRQQRADQLIKVGDKI
ncbi:CRTAC1 family protein [Aestuariibacter sp. A3R04]|uniref:CRTAC1 family protein n=1 Tax=Aestuariibacter sp. A3R04 TaxID=2841571 RepID=UPI001C08B489|nr:CRTAC1 family protein [Aestuariibacter sp. A3R04]MBU3021311.1 CRTAC1 family protein [Aestuariibacter sp. A3R04]